MQTTTTPLERLGQHVVARRKQLGYATRTDLAQAVNFTVRTLADIEHGTRQVSPGTYALLETKLQWTPGTCEHIIGGGDPQHTITNPLAATPTTELLDELHRRINNTRLRDAKPLPDSSY